MTAARIQGVIRDEIAALSAYHVQDATGMVKLDAMENPFAWPETLQAELASRLASASLNRYPDATAKRLKQAVRSAMNIPAGLDILLGNGSDEIIQIVAMAAAKPGAKVLSVEPAFVMFKMIATYCAMDYVGVPLHAENFALDTQALLAAIKTHQPAVTFIAYPNNPTGNLFDRNAIRQILQASSGVVVIDEAYFAFSTESFLDEILAHPNVVLMRTLSKLGLAGLRLGMLIGAPAWIAEFDKVRLPYNINCLTQEAAILALERIAVFRQQTDEIVRQRRLMASALDHVLGQVTGAARFASEANFILIRIPGANAIFEQLKLRKVLVKNTSQAHPLLRDTLRITIGSAPENEQFLQALTDIIETPHA
jgi:histidinol-phosphate aminotransferase